MNLNNFLKTSFCIIILLSQSISSAYVTRRSKYNPVAVDVKIPDDVLDYTSRLKECFYLKADVKNNKATDNNSDRQQILHCDYLSTDGQNLHHVYYTNQKIIDFINKYEKNYPTLQ